MFFNILPGTFMLTLCISNQLQPLSDADIGEAFARYFSSCNRVTLIIVVL
jgi:hypothetical protein